MWEQPGGSGAAASTLGGCARPWFLLCELRDRRRSQLGGACEVAGTALSAHQALLPTPAGAQASREGAEQASQQNLLQYSGRNTTQHQVFM